jgi:hypothetical protein
MKARKYLRVIPSITITSMGQAAGQRQEEAFIGFGRMMEPSQ